MSEFDKDLKPGDLIKAYHSGIHRVTKIEQRFWSEADTEKYRQLTGEYNSLIYYVRVYDSEFYTRNSKELSCDAGYCEKVTYNLLETEKSELFDKIERIKELQQELLEIK